MNMHPAKADYFFPQRLDPGFPSFGKYSNIPDSGRRFRFISTWLCCAENAAA
jgi:hypothetical protein